MKEEGGKHMAQLVKKPLNLVGELRKNRMMRIIV